MGNILCCLCFGSAADGLAKIQEAPGHGRTVSEQFESPKAGSPRYGHLKKVPMWRKVLHLVQYLLRVFDWLSDFILLVALLQQLVIAPSFEVSVSKHVNGIVPMSINYTSVDGNCNFDLSVPISNCSITRQKILPIELDTSQLPITNLCSQTNYPGCCNQELFQKRTKTAYFNLQCPTVVRLIPDVVFVHGTPWICNDLTDGNGSLYSCGFSGAFLLNILIIFTFVFICKEILVVANYRFTIYGMKSSDVAVVSCDSLMLLLVYGLRYFDFFHDAFKNASLKISDNRAFFYTWVVLDFAEKIVSTAIALIVVFSGGSLLGVLAWLSLASSVFSFVMSWRMWYRRMKMALGLMVIDDYEEVVVKQLEKLVSRKCISIDMIKKEHLEKSHCGDGFMSLISYINIQFAVRIVLAFACVVIWIVGQFRYPNFSEINGIEDKSFKYISYKCLGAAFCAFMISEIAVRYSSSSIAKGVLNQDIAEGFLDPNARRLIQRKGPRYYRFVRNVFKKLTFTQKMAIRLVYHPNAFEVFALYIIEIVIIGYIVTNFNFVLVQLTSTDNSSASASIDASNLSNQVSGVADQDRVAYSILIVAHVLFIIFTAIVELNVLVQYFFTNPFAKRVMKLLCCVESIDREVLIHTVINPIIYKELKVEIEDPRMSLPGPSIPGPAGAAATKEAPTATPLVARGQERIVIDAGKVDETFNQDVGGESKEKTEAENLIRSSSADTRKLSSVRKSDAPIQTSVETKPADSLAETPSAPSDLAPARPSIVATDEARTAPVESSSPIPIEPSAPVDSSIPGRAEESKSNKSDSQDVD